MERLWTQKGPFERREYDGEAELESAILKVQSELFGSGRIYLNAKKKIGAAAGFRNIPDGYLIDLTGRKPRLYVVEVELAAHDPLRHIAVQILQFSISFTSEPHKIKQILFDCIRTTQGATEKCEEYIATHDFRNLDHLLEALVMEAPFSALVIIDEMPEMLEALLAKSLTFGVETLELTQYQNNDGERIFSFTPFLQDVSSLPEKKDRQDPGADLAELDTIVVPARDDGFRAVFLGQSRWYAVRIHGTMRPQIGYIAGYQVAPTSAITHIAPVGSIEPWQDTGKFVVNFGEPAQAIGPIPLVKGGRIRQLQGPRYAVRQRMLQAKTLDDVW